MNTFNEILNKYTETIYTNFDEETLELSSRTLLKIENLSKFMKELMTTIFKKVPNDIVIKQLFELDTQNIIVKQFTLVKTIDVNYVKLNNCEKQLSELEEKTKNYKSLEELEKRLAAYTEINDTQNTEITQAAIKDLRDIEKCKISIEALKNMEPDIQSILLPKRYFYFNELLDKCRLEPLELYIDSFREFNKQDVLDAIPHNENKYKYLCATKKLFPNVKAANIHIVANAFAEFIQKIYYNLGVADYNPQKILYLYSMLGGTGKGLFMKRLEHFCNTFKIPVGPNANISTHWLSSEFQLNVVSMIPEFFPYKSNMNEQIINLNNIIDNGHYTIEVKGQQPYSAKSNTTLICGSNKKPFDTNDRRYNVVEYNNVQLFDGEIVEHYKDVLHKEYTPDDWDQIFYDAFTSCPFNFKFKAVTSCRYISDKYIDFVEDVRFLKQENETLFLEPKTIKEIAEALQINSDGKRIKALQKEYKRTVLKNIVGLVNDDLLTPAIKINGTLEYSKYDLNKIAALQINSDEVENTNDLNDPLYETAHTWDILISKYAPDTPTPTPDTPTPTPTPDTTDRGGDIVEDKEIVESVAKQRQALEAICPNTVRNTITENTEYAVTDRDLAYFRTPTKKDVYSKPTMRAKDAQYLVTARYTNEAMKRYIAGEELDAKSENMLPVFFVYEFDSLDKELQIDIATKLYKDNVWTITDSGNKSIHTLVLINPEQAEDVKKDFKYYWNVVAEKLYGTTAVYLDNACASVGRLTRFPDGIRDNGTKQYCMFKNANVHPIDLSNEIKTHNNELDTEKLENTINYVINIEKINKYSKEVDTIEHLRRAVNKSGNPAGQIAVDLVDGIDPGSGANYIGAVGYCQTAIGPKTADLVKALAHKLHPTNI